LPTEIGLELLESPGQRRLADVHVPSGVGDRPGLGHRDERTQQYEIHARFLHAFLA